MTKKVKISSAITAHSTVPRGYCCNTTNNAVEVDFMASLTTEISRRIPSVPNTVNQITEKPAGRNITPFINSPMVRPREILAIKEPVKGAQAIHQAQ